MSEDASMKGKKLPPPAQHLSRAVAGWTTTLNKQAERVDEDVALATLDLLAGVEASLLNLLGREVKLISSRSRPAGRSGSTVGP
jgi:hypothetical protein